MELNEREIFAKAVMIHHFVPALRSFLLDFNPTEFAKWGYNCCRQTAITAVPLLREMLPEYEWTVWDGIFEDIHDGREVTYNHAWVYGKHRDGHGLLVDLARQAHPCLFIKVEENEYPTEGSYATMQELDRQEIDFIEAMGEKEYFTTMDAHVFTLLIIQKAKLSLKGALQNGRLI